MSDDYSVRLASADDVAHLPEIERQAGTLFLDRLDEIGLTEELLADVNTLGTFEEAQRAGHLWVAVSPSRKVVGFALVLLLADLAHLDELDVLPAHGRQGVGSALLDAVCSWARQANCPAITLRTFRDVPWNAPFYERRGFQVVDPSEISEDHERLVEVERAKGLRTDLRVLMAYSITPVRPIRDG